MYRGTAYPPRRSLLKIPFAVYCGIAYPPRRSLKHHGVSRHSLSGSLPWCIAGLPTPQGAHSPPSIEAHSGFAYLPGGSTEGPAPYPGHEFQGSQHCPAAAWRSSPGRRLPPLSYALPSVRDAPPEQIKRNMSPRAKKECQRHAVFPGGHPSKYYPHPTSLNYGERTRTGVSNVLWPLAEVRGERVPSEPLELRVVAAGPVLSSPRAVWVRARCLAMAKGCTRTHTGQGGVSARGRSPRALHWPTYPARCSSYGLIEPKPRGVVTSLPRGTPWNPVEPRRGRGFEPLCVFGYAPPRAVWPGGTLATIAHKRSEGTCVFSATPRPALWGRVEPSVLTPPKAGMVPRGHCTGL